MVARTIDAQASTIAIRTRKTGMLSRLAHDLEIKATEYDVTLDVDGDGWSATLRFPVRGLRVVGALRGDKVDRAILKDKDRADIQRRIVQDHMRFDTVEVRAKGTTHDRCTLEIEAGGARDTIDVSLDTDERPGGAIVASGDLKLSFRRLGIAEIKGPLGAFKLADTIEVAFYVMVTAP